MKRAIWLGGLVMACLLAGPVHAQDQDPVSTVTFVCAEDKSIVAKFYPDEVALTLSDGHGLVLPQVISGSGARYANGDESTVFWNKGNTAFLTEGSDDNMTYKDCVAD
jgi:membrane-bound inhibitor of C-type lysozyme